MCVIDRGAGHGRRDVVLEALDQVVALLDRPVARHEHVHRHERAAGRRARADRVELDVGAPVAREDGLDLQHALGRQRLVHEPVGGAAQQRNAGEHDVDRDGERDDRIEPHPARRRDGEHRDDDADGRPHVRHQVVAVGLERDRIVAVRGGEQQARDREVHHRRDDGHREPEPDLLDGARMEQALDRRPRDGHRRDEDQRAFEGAREVLRLRVAVRVPLVRRTRRQEQQPQRRHRGDDVHDRLERVGQQADRSRDVPRERLQRDRHDRRRERQQREARQVRAVHGIPARTDAQSTACIRAVL